MENEIEDTTVDVTPANPAIIQTPSPVIHLAENLDEQDQLGYCIDTRGRGFNVDLHACLLYTSPSPRDKRQSRMPSSA